jgi:hypothetical protein
LSLTRRKRALERVIPVTTTVLSRVFAVEGRGRDLFRAAERLDLEGIVAKWKLDPYAPDICWYKIKNRAYTQAENRWELLSGAGEPQGPVMQQGPPLSAGPACLRIADFLLHEAEQRVVPRAVLEAEA